MPKAPLVGHVVRSDRYHFVVVKREDGTHEGWLLTDHDIERVQLRADKFDGPLPPVRQLSGFQSWVLRLVGLA